MTTKHIFSIFTLALGIALTAVPSTAGAATRNHLIISDRNIDISNAFLDDSDDVGFMDYTDDEGFIMRDGGICDPIRHMGC